MLPERKLAVVRVKANGQQVVEAVSQPAACGSSLTVGLMLWVNLFALSIIAALF